MIKWKFYFSFLKERDWLESMAREGWLLTDINGGVRYHFKKIEPCEKVYEMERFGLSSQPSVSELTAKSTAIDIANQAGWEVITHDEDMNYYFVKDKAGDESDEFFDEETRLERAERYRKRYCYDLPISTISSLAVFSIVYFLVFLCCIAFDNNDVLMIMLWIYFGFAAFESVFVWFAIRTGNKIYEEFKLNRKEWANYSKHTVKKRFNKIQQLRVFLQEQSENGLSLTKYENKKFYFEEDSVRYDYFVDTKSSLKKRLKADGVNLAQDKKDLLMADTRWHELSIEHAKKHNLKPVTLLDRNIIIYKRAHSEEPLPWENGNENLFKNDIHPVMAIIMIIAFCIGFYVGFAL